MKKLFNSRFLFILASSIVVLILLIVGAFYLFDDVDDSFVKSGYVLNPLSSTAEKYFFDENVGYRENLSSMIEFVDVDENKVTVLKDSFIHYMDESMSFLKRGAILDLNSLKGSSTVSFYNITNKSIIEKKNNEYVIESSNGDIKLNNFVGRISDDKYIVVGDLSLKMAGNATTVKGDYFEIVYIEEGIVNIENKNVKYQVAAADSFIYVGNDKVIDLGDKKITVNGEDVMSITAITIDGDENIEIIPKAEEEEEEDDGGEADEPTTPEENIGTGIDGEGEGEGGTGNEGVEGELTKEVVVSLKDAKIGSTSVDVTFDVLNAEEDDLFKLQIVNLDSGKTVDIVAQVLADVPIQVNLLTPSTKYLFMVINEKDNNKYFQKVFETTGFGIKLEKSYATESSLAYKVTIEEGTDITNAKLALYKFNEETMQNEIVTSSYVDNDGNVIINEKVTYLSTIDGNIEGEHEIVYDGLDNNTIYTAVLDEFSVASSNFKDIYNITLTAMTLKKLPLFSEMTVTKDVGAGSFDLSLGNITDPDNAIVSYTYMIYDKFTNELVIEPIVHTNASPITVLIGDEKNQLKNDTNYYYKAIIEYFDNEKYIEYVTSDSIIFNMGSDPYITVVENTDLIDYDTIAATIYLRDNSCLISVPGREKCNGNSTTVIEISRINAVTGEKVLVQTKNILFDVNGKEIKYDMVIDGLEPGTIYGVDVKANFNNSDALQRQEVLHTDESKRLISTRSFTKFSVEWTNVVGYEERPINAKVQLHGDPNSGTMTPDESAETLETIVLRLYDGRNTQDLATRIPMAEVTFPVYGDTSFNIKENFYDKAFELSNDLTFGLTLEQLEARSKDGKLSEYYTISMEVYAQGGNRLDLVNDIFTYRVAPGLFNDAETILEISAISKSNEPELFPNVINDGTIIGYNVYAYYDRSTLLAGGLKPLNINFYVYDKLKNKLNFYVKNKDGELELTNKYVARVENDENNFYNLPIYMDYGTAYEVKDDIMRRGNSFYIGYEIEISISGDETSLYPLSTDNNSPTGYGMYKPMNTEKESPNLKMYIAKSTANSITYRYELKDSDNAVYKEEDSDQYGFYSVIGNNEEIKIPMMRDEEITGYNQFAGEFTLDGLSNGSLYSIYYKRNASKTSTPEKDIVPYLDGTNGVRTFDGYYDLNDISGNYGFNYQIINDPLNDNKVVVKILARDDVLARILSYKLKFTAKDDKGKEIVLNKELWKLSACDNNNEFENPRCLSVDYIELANAGMKSDGNKVRNISLEVKAIYDNGLQGYDYKVGNTDSDDYLYTILQANSSDTGLGRYISFSNTGQNLTTWTEEIEAPKGYYTYKFNERTSQITYTSQWATYETKFRVNLTAGGYYYSNVVSYITPKMVSVGDMICYSVSQTGSCNQFSFNTVTPTVDVNVSTSLINGAIVNLQLYGIDINDIRRETDGERYLYIETWDTRSLAEANKLDKVVRPAVRVKINSSNPTAKISTVVDGLKELKTGSDVETTGMYFFNVYAYMNDGSGKYRQLYDEDSDGYKVVTYNFNTLRVGDLYHSSDLSFTASDEVYGNRTLNSKINLIAYKNSTAYNFDIIYVLCKVDDAATCGPNEGDTNIFKKVIPVENVATTIQDTEDISSYDLEFGRDYLLAVYVSSDFYDPENGNELTKRNILINPYNRNVVIRKLVEPSFVATRNAILDNGQYGIDFSVVVNDNDRTLIDGKYYVKLLDSDGNVVGNMKLLDEKGTYYDVSNYQDYAFDAFVVNKKIRIVGLDSNKKYTFMIFSDAYLNNYSPDTLPGKENRTVEVTKSYSVYSTNDYGVAFGDATYGVTEKSVIVTFLGGSNFENVTEVNYTVGLWDDELSSSTVSGTFKIGENNKRFELYKNSEDWRFVIDPAGMKNVLGKTYKINISFKVRIPGTSEYIVLTSADIPSFEGTVTYYEDEK